MGLRLRESGDLCEASTLKDELDRLQEENVNILEKLRIDEGKSEEAETRARELEKHISSASIADDDQSRRKLLQHDDIDEP
ncbi:hypothetical protein J5N97_001708 [Dioscorea zingiberensis]|uniref:Uncharacterized protein n=1 Tax=Dioscorea zingiberensis TaxID=325984 RepID=A0A9D5BVX2_9LILI|nr:hypothetical protein J5N97_001708 [Dioscorea zingiberensis]